MAAFAFAFARVPLATRADVNAHDGGSVRIDVTKLGVTAHPTNVTALYRDTMNAYWQGAIAQSFCDGLVKRIEGLGAVADGSSRYIDSCGASPQVGSLTLNYSDRGLTGGVIIQSTQWVDLVGVEGTWTDRSKPYPDAKACFHTRLTIDTSVLFHPDTLAYDRAIVSVGGGYPQPGCASASVQHPPIDDSDAFGAYVRSANFGNLAMAALTAAHADPNVPLGKALDVYAPTVRSLRTQFRLKPYYGSGGTLVFAFSNGRDRLDYGSKFEMPTSGIPAPEATRNGIR